MAVERITLVKFGVCTVEVVYDSSIYLDGVCLRRFSGFLYTDCFYPVALLLKLHNKVKNFIRYTGRAKKSNPLGKILYLWNCSRFFSPNLQRLQARIQATYPVNSIKITHVVQ